MYTETVPNRNSPPAILLRQGWREGKKTRKRTWPTLATPREWSTTTLAEELGVQEGSEDELYAAMDWLRERQARIEKKLAARHLREGGLVLYDGTSSSYAGRTCPLVQWGHTRDADPLPLLVYGVMTDAEGCPVGVEVDAGNTGDPPTVSDQVGKLRQRFGRQRVVLVGDRGMLTPPQIDKLRQHPGLGWITALTSGAIRELVEKGAVQLSLRDEKNLAEITSPDYPGERLGVCHNPLLETDCRVPSTWKLNLALSLSHSAEYSPKPLELRVKLIAILG